MKQCSALTSTSLCSTNGGDVGEEVILYVQASLGLSGFCLNMISPADYFLFLIFLELPHTGGERDGEREREREKERG